MLRQWIGRHDTQILSPTYHTLRTVPSDHTHIVMVYGCMCVIIVIRGILDAIWSEMPNLAMQWVPFLRQACVTLLFGRSVDRICTEADDHTDVAAEVSMGRVWSIDERSNIPIFATLRAISNSGDSLRYLSTRWNFSKGLHPALGPLGSNVTGKRILGRVRLPTYAHFASLMRDNSFFTWSSWSVSTRTV